MSVRFIKRRVNYNYIQGLGLSTKDKREPIAASNPEIIIDTNAQHIPDAEKLKKSLENLSALRNKKLAEEIQIEEAKEEKRKQELNQHKFTMGMKWSSGSSTPNRSEYGIDHDNEASVWESIQSSADKKTERLEDTFDNVN